MSHRELSKIAQSGHTVNHEMDFNEFLPQMSGMKKALNKDDRKKDEIGDIRARERLQEQNKAKTNQLGSQTQVTKI